MFGEIGAGFDSERLGAYNSSVETVNGAIASAAQTQGASSLEHALKSFAWADTQQAQEGDMIALNDPEVNIQLPGFTDAPGDFLARAVELPGGNSANCTAIVPMDRLLGLLRSQDFNFNDGLSNLTESGLKEALFSKENLLSALGARVAQGTPSPELLAKSSNIDDLLQTDTLKNSDGTELQAALHKVSQMFSAVQNLVDVALALRLNVLRGMRF